MTEDYGVRIADFGLTVRAVAGKYISVSAEKLPWAWISPETLKSGIFTFKTDVWAAGVTLWEVTFT